MTILLADESKIIRKILRNILIKVLGSDVIFFEADNGQRALEKIDVNLIDFVFLDWNMPIIKGDKVVKMIRLNSEYDLMKIIMTTTQSNNFKVLNMVENEVNGSLAKPFCEADVIRTVQLLHCDRTAF
jgi:two-component system, chemotaxis family, chemotaxis protein CheY